jgi:hypothetical protein
MKMSAEIADIAEMVVSAIPEKNPAVFPNSSGSLKLLLGLGFGFSRYYLIESKPMVTLPSQMKEAGMDIDGVEAHRAFFSSLVRAFRIWSWFSLVTS